MLNTNSHISEMGHPRKELPHYKWIYIGVGLVVLLVCILLTVFLARKQHEIEDTMRTRIYTDAEKHQIMDQTNPDAKYIPVSEAQKEKIMSAKVKTTASTTPGLTDEEKQKLMEGK